MADSEEPTSAEDVDIDRSLDRRGRWVYLVFALIALCVVVAIARYFIFY